MSAYRFPVYLLGLPGEAIDRLYSVCGWCVVTAGVQAIRQDEDGAIETYHARKESGKAAGGDGATWEGATDNGRRVVVGQSEIGEENGTVASYLGRYNTAQNWIDSMTNRFGPPSFVSVGHKLLWEQIHQLREGTPASLEWRQFATLCAVNCAIGDKKSPFPITRDFLRAASIGFKTGKGYFLADGKVSPKGQYELKKCRNDLAFPTVRQLRDDLEQLEAQGLVGRVLVSRRATAYFRPDVCTRTSALEWLKKVAVRRESTDKLRQEEREILEEAAKDHSGPVGDQSKATTRPVPGPLGGPQQGPQQGPLGGPLS